MPIVDLQRRLHEVGRIRIGQLVPTDRGTRPARLDTFRVTSQDRRALESVALLYGGTVQRWQAAPVGEQWEVITEAAELRVAIPPERMALSQWMELWSGGGCIRRCDGVRQDNDEPCVCAQLDGDDPAPRCSRHTRLSLMLADLATSGLWRLDTQGFYASVELAGSFELSQLVAAGTGRVLLPGWLRLEQREIRRPGEQVKRFAVPVLDLEMDTRGLLAPSQAAALVGAPQTLVIAEGDIESSAGLTPIPVGVSTLADELAAVNEPELPKPRRNAAAPLPSTGRPRRTAAERHDTVEQQPPHETPTFKPTDKPTDEQRGMLFALLNERGMTERPARLLWANTQIERLIESYTDLTRGEVSQLIDTLLSMRDADPVDDVLDADPGPER